MPLNKETKSNQINIMQRILYFEATHFISNFQLEASSMKVSRWSNSGEISASNSCIVTETWQRKRHQYYYADKFTRELNWLRFSSCHRTNNSVVIYKLRTYYLYELLKSDYDPNFGCHNQLSTRKKNVHNLYDESWKVPLWLSFLKMISKLFFTEVNERITSVNWIPPGSCICIPPSCFIESRSGGAKGKITKTN